MLFSFVQCPVLLELPKTLAHRQLILFIYLTPRSFPGPTTSKPIQRIHCRMLKPSIFSFFACLAAIHGLPTPTLNGNPEHRHESVQERAIPDSEVNQKPDSGVFPEPRDIVPVKAPIWDSEEVEQNATLACDESNAPGSHMVYCSGKLLHAVMTTHVYVDSKTFVDRPMKKNTTGSAIAAEFEQRFPGHVEDLNRAEIAEFVDEFFEEAGQELRGCNLTDWQENPEGVMSISDGTLRKFGLELNSVWKYLCREVDPIVEQEPQRFSLIHLPYPFIVPGGRFRENYYWDAYWIVKGLLVSGMTQTVRGMIRNSAHMVNRFGFVPNGGRIYYLQRSQPPMLTPMVYEYYQKTKDTEFLRDMLPVLEKEFDFWEKQRSTEVRVGDETLTLFQYRTPLNAPRPESYREDMTTAQTIESMEAKRHFFQNLASAAESGWDFSTRWLRDKASLASVETTNILPVDLNAFMCYNMHIISYLHAELGNSNKEQKWAQDYFNFRETFRKTFYVKSAKGWYDFNLRLQEHNLDFYPSMAVPLFTQCYNPLSTTMVEEVYEEMEKMGAFNFSGGVPTSLYREGTQQWDFPNGWSPLNHMIVEGLRKSGNPRLQQRAFQLAEKWVLSNFKVYQQDRVMWEKYDVVAARPRTGDGGEYEVQAGFGWTNGVILDLLSTYGDRLRFPDIHPPIVTVPTQFRREERERVAFKEVSRSSSALSVLSAISLLAVLIF